MKRRAPVRVFLALLGLFAMPPRTRLRLAMLLLAVAIVVLVALASRRFGGAFLGGVVCGFVLAATVVVVGFKLLASVVREKVQENLRPARVRRLRGWDYAMRLRALDGATVEAATFRGRVLFLNFWATWCAPCVAEMPSIERLVARFAEAGSDVAFACVTSESPETVRSFVAKRGWKLPVYVLEGETPALFETRSIPATFVLTTDGNLALQHTGAARWDTEEIMNLLNELGAAA
jgi:thiol-disulfide isomerase/thioredoxin